MENQKNILILLLAGIIAWLGVEVWLKPKAPQPIPSAVTSAQAPYRRSVPLEQALSGEGRLAIRTPFIQGSINLKGGGIDDWSLSAYRQSPEAKSPIVRILSPENTEAGYTSFFRWYIAGDREAPCPPLTLPSDDTEWKADGQEIIPNRPVTLSWLSPQNILFRQILSVDDHYMLTITQEVENKSSTPISLGTVGKIRRMGPVKTSGYMMLHEGPIGILGGQLKEKSYDSLIKERTGDLESMDGGVKGTGWIGITDKYWLTALVPSQATQGAFTGFPTPPTYQTETVSAPQVINPGHKTSVTTHFFAGPKLLSLLESYEKSLRIDHFDLAVDFGWFYFLTRPMFSVLSWLKTFTGSFGLAILCLTVLIKFLFFPLSLKSYRSMARIRKYQPHLQALREKYGHDKMRLNQEMIAFYKKEKINPVSGCLPMLIQIPIFFSLYKVLFISIEMRQAPFWGWIKDLSAPDPSNIFTVFGLIPWHTPSWLHLGVWPLFMGITMILQQRSNTSMPLDAHQKIMFNYVMPAVFTFMMSQFPAGLVIYWTWSNLLTVGQQWVMTRYYAQESS
jgi:YidC/Oxa1 family membrane protein insertase